MPNLPSLLHRIQVLIRGTSLQIRFIVIIGVSLLLFSVLIWFVFKHMTDRVIVRIGTTLAEKQVLYDKTRTLLPLIREVALVRKMADSPLIKHWAVNEQDPALRAAALAEMEAYRHHFQDGSYFFAPADSSHFYFNNARGEFTGKQLRYTLNRNNPSDNWFYATMDKPQDYHLNIDFDTELGVSKIWINMLLRDKNKVLGVIGTGFDLSGFINNVANLSQPGIINVFLDSDGAIQLYHDQEYIDFSSIGKSVDKRRSIDQLLPQASDRIWVRHAIKEATINNTTVPTRFIQFKGKRYLAAVTALPEIGWFDVNLLDLDVLLPRRDFIDIALTLAGVVFGILLIMAITLRRLILKPVAKLKFAARRVSQGDLSSNISTQGLGEIEQLIVQFNQMTDAIREHQHKLEKVVAERTQELSNAKDQLEISSQQDSRARLKFLAQMSHEFRTPLNTVLGFSELLLRGSARVSLPEGIAAIKTSTRHLLGMIDDILNQVRGESGQLVLHTAPVAWKSFIQSLEQTAAMMMQDHGNQFQLQLTGEMPAVVRIDELHLHVVLSNLLSNANRYTHDGKIILTCASEAMDDGYCRFTLTVSDTGLGIAANEQSRIFEPFVRGTAGKTSGIDGIGMGLVIAQQWIKLMGGEILVNSTPGQGSSFYFSIECELAEVVPEISTIPERAVVQGKHRILIVEDDENSRKLLAMLLADYGFEVLTAKSGKDARQFLPPHPNHNDAPNPSPVCGSGAGEEGIDLVITDQFMPDGDGWSVLQDWMAIPVMLLSAAAPDRPSNLPANLKFTSVHLKPFDRYSLLQAIGTILAVEWAETKADDAPTALIQPPPMALLAPLKTMIEQGAVTDIAEWLANFDAKYPQHHAYTAQIITANLMLDFKALRRLTTL